MTRFAFIFLLLLSAVGCQTAAHSPQKAVIVHHQNSAKQFWNKTAQLLQPQMPDTGGRSVETENQLALRRVTTDILPVNHTTHSLYKPNTIFPSPSLALQQPLEHVLTVETTSSIVSANPLQIQAEDSEAFQSLLREIAIMPDSRRKVDNEKLTELLSSFRNEIMGSDVEEDYLALLRRRILPETVTPRTSAPLPHVANNAARNRQYGDDSYDEPLPRRTTQDRVEPIIAQNTMTMPRPNYPDLPQLPHAGVAAHSGVVQMSYQSQPPHVPQSLMSSYGAGDWQAPTRLAIEQLRYAIEHTPNGRSASNEMRLRMLEMLLGNRTEAARPMQTDKTLNDFMAHQVLGFSELLDDTVQDNRSKYIRAAFRFNEGLTELQNLCPIRLKNVTFAKEWFGYGQFVPRPAEFYPGEPFHVYVEVENPMVRETDMYEICISTSYVILDSRANTVASSGAAQPGGEMFVSRKRDFYTGIHGVVPASLPPGEYQLRINLTDLNDPARQYADEQIPFRVVPSMDGMGTL